MHKAHGEPPSPPAACSGLFIDVGANSGSSLNSWYEQEGCEDLKLRMGEAWPGIKRSACAWEWPPWLPLNLRRRYCAEAFEPNPRLSQRLLETARRLERAHGVSIAVYNGTAFSTTTGSALLRLDRTKGGLGSSLLLHKPNTTQWRDAAPVRTVDPGGSHRAHASSHFACIHRAQTLLLCVLLTVRAPLCAAAGRWRRPPRHATCRGRMRHLTRTLA